MKHKSNEGFAHYLLFIIFLILLGAISFHILNSRTLVRQVSPTNDQTILKSEQANKKRLSDKIATIETAAKISAYPQIGYASQCEKGEANWKRTDPFKVRCSQKITKFYGFDGDFKQNALRLSNAIDSLGATNNDRGTIPETLSEYYDVYYNSELNGSTYLVSNLPASGYSYNNGDLIEVEFAEKRTIPEIAFEFIQYEWTKGALAGNYFKNEQFVDQKQIFNELSSMRDYVLALAISGEYYYKQ